MIETNHTCMSKKVLIADDHSILREGLKNLMESIPSISVIDEAVDGREALKMIRGSNYDLLILDISMPGISGIDVLQSLKDSGTQCRSLILSLHPEDVYASRAIKLGSVGYISKSASFDEIREAINRVIHGGRYVSAGLAEKLAFNDDNSLLPHEKLSDREFQVMILLANGKSISEIAEQICISDKTVSTYRSRIMKKMDMHCNAELTMYAINNKLIN